MKFLKYHPSYYWTRFKDSIKYFFSPRQKWLRKKIPRHFVNLDTIFEITILEGIKFYCEKDVTLENLNAKMGKDFPAHQGKFTKELRYIYKLVTVNLPNLEKRLETAWSKVSPTDFDGINCDKISYEKKYGEINRLERQIEKTKTKIMVWATSNRHSLWH